MLFTKRLQMPSKISISFCHPAVPILAFTRLSTVSEVLGKDIEWRYIPVRRFFDMVTASVDDAISRFEFEPNDSNTWVKIRLMVENFLHIQWRLGAMAGVKPEHAFYVRVGLGQTMTVQDITDGNLIVEIGMAVVRPAEFIILRVNQKLQPT